MAELASALVSERKVCGLIPSEFNVGFDLHLIRGAIALNTRKTEHIGRQRGKGCTVNFH